MALRDGGGVVWEVNRLLYRALVSYLTVSRSDVASWRVSQVQGVCLASIVLQGVVQY